MKKLVAIELDLDPKVLKFLKDIASILITAKVLGAKDE